MSRWRIAATLASAIAAPSPAAPISQNAPTVG
jgi:hypothetical protein